MLQSVEKSIFPGVCFLIGLGSLIFKGGGWGLAVGLLFFVMGILHIKSARFPIFFRTYGEAADAKDKFIVSRNEIVSDLKAMISHSGAVDAERFGVNSFQGTVEFADCHEVPIALIPVGLEKPDCPDDGVLQVGSGWGVAYFCPADDRWKATPFFHFNKPDVIDAFSNGLGSILQASLETLK